MTDGRVHVSNGNSVQPVGASLSLSKNFTHYLLKLKPDFTLIYNALFVKCFLLMACELLLILGRYK